MPAVGEIVRPSAARRSVAASRRSGRSRSSADCSRSGGAPAGVDRPSNARKLMGERLVGNESKAQAEHRGLAFREDVPLEALPMRPDKCRRSLALALTFEFRAARARGHARPSRVVPGSMRSERRNFSSGFESSHGVIGSGQAHEQRRARSVGRRSRQIARFEHADAGRGVPGAAMMRYRPAALSGWP
jgi:hypothetical protein